MIGWMPKGQRESSAIVILVIVAIGIALVFLGWQIIEHFYPGGM
jgi:hypothetical protein